MTDQNIDPIDALTDAGLKPIIIDEHTDFDALPKFNAFTISDVLIHLRPDLAEASAISGAEFEKAGLPMFGGCYVCGAAVAAYNACPGKNGFLVGTCCATAHNTFATIEEFLASRETNDSTICPSCGDSEGGSSCCPDAMERYFEERLAQHQETIERQAKRIAALEEDLRSLGETLNSERADLDALLVECNAALSDPLEARETVLLPEHRRGIEHALATVARMTTLEVVVNQAAMRKRSIANREAEPKDVWTCDECGSEHVQGTAWIHLNSNTIVQGDPPDDDYWCEDCDGGFGAHVTATCGPRKTPDHPAT